MGVQCCPCSTPISIQVQRHHSGHPSISVSLNWWLKWLLNKHKPPCFGLLPLSLTPCSPQQGGLAARVAQRNTNTPLSSEHSSSGQNLCSVKSPWMRTGTESLSLPNYFQWFLWISGRHSALILTVPHLHTGLREAFIFQSCQSGIFPCSINSLFLETKK